MPRQYFFWKYLNTIIVLYCIIVQKSPNFVQLSPIQCTYSNIFIRFFKFFPANTNIYQNSYRVIGVLCGLRQGVLSSQCGYLISFGTKYSVIASVAWQSPGREPYLISARNDRVLRTDNNKWENYTICSVLSIKTQNYKRHFIRFHQLPHLINTTIYQYIIIKIE